MILTDEEHIVIKDVITNGLAMELTGHGNIRVIVFESFIKLFLGSYYGCFLVNPLEFSMLHFGIEDHRIVDRKSHDDCCNTEDGHKDILKFDSRGNDCFLMGIIGFRSFFVL